MTLLREIQVAATESDVPLPTILRKCKVLASRLRHEPFKEWTEWELTGYPNEDALPDYRKSIPVLVLGDFSGPFGSGLKNAPIPQLSIDEEHRDWLFQVSFRDGVAALEDLVHSPEGGLRYPWPADVVAYYGQRIYENMNCLTAHRVVSTAVVTGILDTIRTRVLSFALEIEEAAPEAGEGDPGAVSAGTVSQIFNTYIYGGHANVAGTAGTVVQSSSSVLHTAWPGLREELAKLGLPEPDLVQLQEAIAGDDAEGEPFGTRTQSWLGRITARLATGAMTLTTGASADLIAGLLLRHLS